MSNFIKEYCQFSKKERLGILVLILLIGLFVLVPELYQSPINKIYIDSSVQFNSSASAVELANTSKDYTANEDRKKGNRLFSFNPNLASPATLSELGLTDKNIRTILNYRLKGGRFMQPSDLRKIWGIRLDDAERLIPYIVLEPSTVSEKHNGTFRKFANYSKPAIPILDINLATVTEWEALPGIGPVLAARIVKYRDKIGGFTQLTQVQKTYGISDSLFNQLLPYLRVNTGETSAKEPATSTGTNLNKLNINKATVAQLIEASVPEEIAKAIVLYRKQYGLYETLSDLKKIVFISESVYMQIAPKLQVQ